MGTDCQKCRGHCVAILHEKLGCGLVKVWRGGLPKFFDLAKIGLANGQPGSDTKSVTTGFPDNKFPEKTVVLISPRITVS